MFIRFTACELGGDIASEFLLGGGGLPGRYLLDVDDVMQ